MRNLLFGLAAAAVFCVSSVAEAKCRGCRPHRVKARCGAACRAHKAPCAGQACGQACSPVKAGANVRSCPGGVCRP